MGEKLELQTRVAAELTVDPGAAGFAAFSSDTGEKFGTVAANDAALAGAAWTTPANVLTDNDLDTSAVLGDQYPGWRQPGTGSGAGWSNPMGVRTPDLTGDHAYRGEAGWSVPLVAQGFGFAIPADAQIMGIQVAALRNSWPGNYGTGVYDWDVQVRKAGAATMAVPGRGGGDPYWDPVNWRWDYFGGSTDLWGTTWTAAQINATNFGWHFQCYIESFQGYYGWEATNAYCDAMQMRVWYHRETQFVKATTFGFSLPAGSTVTGISAEVKHNQTDVVRDRSVQLVKANAVVGSNKAVTTAWPANKDSEVVYGGNGDMWGTTWTQAEVQAAGFGIAVAAKGYGTALIDTVKLTVFYSVAGQQVAVTGQPKLRFGPEERLPERQLLSVSCATEMPGGFASASISAPPFEFYTPVDYVFADARIYEYETNRTLHEGRVVGVSETAEGVSFEIEGWSRHLQDDKTAREIFYDRDLTAWKGPSVSEKLLQMTGNYTASDGNATEDKETAIPAFSTEGTTPWDAGSRPMSEGWYDGEGVFIGGVDYAWKKSTTINPALAQHGWDAILRQGDDNNAQSRGSTGNLIAAGPSSGMLVSNGATATYATVRMYSTVAQATSNVVHSIYWTLLGIYGMHGLTLRGTVNHPNTGRGIRVSDMAPYAVGAWAPLLKIGQIDATTFDVPHLVFKEPTTVVEMLEAMVLLSGTTFEPLDWWVDEDRTFNMQAPADHGTTWHTKYEEGTEADSSGPDAQEMLNGIIVSYDNGSGTRRTVGPPGSGADSVDQALVDLSDANPANRTGAQHWERVDAGITTTAGAVLVGQCVLFDRNKREWRGTVRIKDQVRDDTGTWLPTALVRAGDRLVIEDDRDARARRIIGTSYNSAERIVECEVGTRPDRLPALMAQMAGVLTGKI